MYSYVFVIIWFYFSSSMAIGQETVILSEAALKEFIAQSPPSVQQIEVSFLTAQHNQMSKLDQYGFRLDADTRHFKSGERLLNNFDGGVIKNSSSYSVGLTKPTPYGVDIGVKAFGEKASNAFVSDATTTGVSVSLALDLYENFLGRRSHSDLKVSELSVERSRLERKSQLKSFESNLRKIYWSLVANNEQEKLLKSLVASADKTYKDSAARKKSGVADAGEVARYRSQWTTRKANLLSIGYRRSELIRSLKELVPSLNGKEIKLDNYNVEQATQKVLACTAKVDSYVEAPFQYTVYDEIVGFLKEEASLKKKLADAYGDPKIKLIGEYASVGRDFGYDMAQQNYYSDPRARKSIGLQVSIPLGSRTKDHSEVMKMIAKNRYRALIEEKLAKIRAYHSETTRTIKTLQQVVRNQKDSNEQLDRSLKVSQRKFKQARISLQELISEEDAHIQSRLNEIDTNLTIINTLMDYFSIYADTPCEFNRI